MIPKIPDLPNDLVLRYQADFLSKEDSLDFYNQILKEVSWTQQSIRLFGKTHLQPRWIAWQGSEEYRYSGTTLKSSPFTPAVEKLKNKVEEALQLSFNGVLINYYRNGSDSMGWHSDDEKELGLDPTIPAISLGEPRILAFRQKGEAKSRRNFLLSSGSLLIMEGPTQQKWQHALPKTTRLIRGRINLTFRRIKQTEQ